MPDGAIRTLAFVHDVTEARQAGRALRITEDRFRAMAENAADLIGEIDGSGRFVYVSPNCESLLGTPAEQFIGMTVAGGINQERLHPDDRAALNGEFVPRVASGGEGQIEYRYLHADGSWRWFETRGRGYRTQGGELRVLLISRDVTERVRTHQALRVSEERYRVLAETTHDLVIELDAEGKVVYLSPNCQPTLGYAPEELVGTLPFALLHPDDIERLAESLLEPGCLLRAAADGDTAPRQAPRRLLALAGRRRRQLPHRQRRDARGGRGARHHRAAPGRGGAAQAGGMDPPGPEAGEPRPAGGRHRARLQQPADADPRRRESRADRPAGGFERARRGWSGSRRRRSAPPCSPTSCSPTPAGDRWWPSRSISRGWWASWASCWS